MWRLAVSAASRGGVGKLGTLCAILDASAKLAAARRCNGGHGEGARMRTMREAAAMGAQVREGHRLAAARTINRSVGFWQDCGPGRVV
jgi:hypothetical protein